MRSHAREGKKRLLVEHTFSLNTYLVCYPMLRLSMPKLSPITLFTIGFLFAFTAVARPLVDFLRHHFGNFGIALLLWFVFIVVLLWATRHLTQAPRAVQGCSAFFFLLSLIYLQSFSIVEERVHLFKFGGLSLLIMRDLRQQYRFWPSLVLSFLLCSLIGALDEGWQYILPSRVGDLRDVVFNTIGAAWGCLLFLLLFESSSWKNRGSRGTNKGMDT